MLKYIALITVIVAYTAPAEGVDYQSDFAQNYPAFARGSFVVTVKTTYDIKQPPAVTVWRIAIDPPPDGNSILAKVLLLSKMASR